MTRNSSFIRKVVYLCLIALLLIPISMISRPATHEDPGGKLAELRTDYGLSQAELGEIDPASATMQLATLGLRGPAATLLWNRAINFQMREQWDNLAATLNQIAKIQPHMINVWKFQAWNVAYNVSVEFDDYHMRYNWVKKGVDFMLKGTRYNAQSPKLLNDLGWFFSHKFGRSDDRLQYRRMFKNDTEFHETLPFETSEWDQVRRLSPDDKPDNWLVSWLWHLRAERAAEEDPRKDLGGAPLVFYSRAPMALMYFAPAIEEDGYLDEKARHAWTRAGEEWHEYGNRNLLTSYGVQITLNNLEHLRQQIDELNSELAELAPGVEEELVAQRRVALSDQQRVALDTSYAQRTPEQFQLAREAERALEVPHREVAENAPEESRARALVVAAKLKTLEAEAVYTDRYREQVNFEYWRTRSEIERTQTAINARRNLFDALAYYREAKLEPAREAYEKAWVLWAEIFQEHPEMLEDTTAEDLMDSVNRYAELLRQVEVSFPPPDFPLMDLLRVQDPDFSEPASTEEAPPEGAARPDEDAEASESATSPPAGEGESPEDSQADTPPAAGGDEDQAASEDQAAETRERGEAETATQAETAGESQSPTAEP